MRPPTPRLDASSAGTEDRVIDASLITGRLGGDGVRDGLAVAREEHDELAVGVHGRVRAAPAESSVSFVNPAPSSSATASATGSAAVEVTMTIQPSLAAGASAEPDLAVDERDRFGEVGGHLAVEAHVAAGGILDGVFDALVDEVFDGIREAAR